MSLFAQQVTSPFDLGSAGTTVSSTVGQALMWAKNEYISELQSFSVYDEKAVMESTFYGLPVLPGRHGADRSARAPVGVCT